MHTYTLTDEYGRRTVFIGEELLSHTTDDGRKPRWTDITVWRTASGNYVVQEETSFRVRHLDQHCGRAEGYELAPADDEDVAACSVCNPSGALGPGWAQESRITIDHYDSPATLVAKLGREETRFSRWVLSELSKADPDIARLWMTVVVP